MVQSTFVMGMLPAHAMQFIARTHNRNKTQQNKNMKLVISRLCKSLASALTELRRSVVQSLGCLFDDLVKQTMSLNLIFKLFYMVNIIFSNAQSYFISDL